MGFARPLALIAATVAILATGAPTASPTDAPTPAPTADISVYFTLKFSGITPKDFSVAEQTTYMNAVAAALPVPNDRVAAVSNDGSQLRSDGGQGTLFEFRVFATSLSDVAVLQNRIGNEQAAVPNAFVSSVSTATGTTAELQAKTIRAKTGTDCNQAVCVDNAQDTAAPSLPPTASPTGLTNTPTESPTFFPTPGRVRAKASLSDGRFYPCRPTSTTPTDAVGPDEPADAVGDVGGACGWYYMEAKVVIKGERLNDEINGFLSSYTAQGEKSYVNAFAGAVAAQCNTTIDHVGITEVSALTTGSETNVVGSKGHSYDSVSVSFGVSAATKADADHCKTEINQLASVVTTGTAEAVDRFHQHTVDHVHASEYSHYTHFVNTFKNLAASNGVDDRQVTVELIMQDCSEPATHWMSNENMDRVNIDSTYVCMFEDRLREPAAAAEEHAGWTDEMIATGVVCTGIGIAIVAIATVCMTRTKRPAADSGTKVNVAQSNV